MYRNYDPVKGKALSDKSEKKVYKNFNPVFPVFDYEKTLEANEARKEKNFVAMSRFLVRASQDWTFMDMKTLILLLTKIDWTKDNNTNEIILDDAEICDKLDIQTDANHRSGRIRTFFDGFTSRSMLRWTDPHDKDIWEDGLLFVRSKKIKNKVIVIAQDYYMPLLENLLKDHNYIKIFADDIFAMKTSSRVFTLYMDLWFKWDDRYEWNERFYSVADLKKLFNLDDNTYMHKYADGTMHFNRGEFEKKCINDPLLYIHSHTNAITIMPTSESLRKAMHFQADSASSDLNTDNKKLRFFRRKKDTHGRVEGYIIRYQCKTHSKNMHQQLGIQEPPEIEFDEDEEE